MQLDKNKNDFFFVGCLIEARAEQMQTINCIFKYSLFRTKTDVFILNVPILQLHLRSRHNPDIRDCVKNKP